MLFPAKSKIRTVLEFVNAAWSSLIPESPISLRFKQRTSRYFLSYNALPKAAAPSGNTPLFDSQSS